MVDSRLGLLTSSRYSHCLTGEHRWAYNVTEIMARMNKQMDEEIKMKLCNFIIMNDEQQLLIPQVMALHETILSLAENK